MNLQILAIQTIMNSGIKYDDTDPIMKNVMFDLDGIINETDDKINKLKKQIINSRKNLYKFSQFNAIPIKDSKSYDQIVDELSTLLFDDMNYSRITTIEQIKWKEYFHGLYDLVVFPYQSDRTHHLQMTNDIYKYYDILEIPKKQLEVTDPLYVDVKFCQDLFKKLKIEHKKMMIPKIFKKMKQNVENQVTRRFKHKNMEIKLEKLYKYREQCTKLVKWSLQ